MGVIRDSVTLVFIFGAATAVCAIVVVVYASSYLATYPSDDKDPGQSQTVYYAVFYIRVLAILTTVSMTAYLAWNYADSRHRMTNKKDIKLTAVTMRRITNSGLASSENSRAHRKKLLYGMFAFFMLWLPPALVMCFQGWLYKYKKPEKNQTTLLSACSVDGRSPTCAKLYSAGVSSLIECLLFLLAFVALIVGLMSKGPERDVERDGLIRAQEDARRAQQIAEANLAGAQQQLAQQQGNAGTSQAAINKHQKAAKEAQAALTAAQARVTALEQAEENRKNAARQTLEAQRAREARARRIAAEYRRRQRYEDGRYDGRHGDRRGRRRHVPSTTSMSSMSSSSHSSSSSGRGGRYMSGANGPGRGGGGRRTRYSPGGEGYRRGRPASRSPRPGRHRSVTPSETVWEDGRNGWLYDRTRRYPPRRRYEAADPDYDGYQRVWDVWLQRYASRFVVGRNGRTYDRLV